MDAMQVIINLTNEKNKYKSGAEYNIGRLVEDLNRCDQEKQIWINCPDSTEYVYPYSFDSWRGRYCELSTSFCHSSIKVAQFLELAKSVIGQTFRGYKGGDFLMDKYTPIHIARYGESDFCGQYAKVIGVKEHDNYVELLYRDDEDDD